MYLQIHNLNCRTLTRAQKRSGFAPVEMTLVLPLLMFMMAAIVAFGFNACWKLRTENVARDVTWRNRHPHKGSWNANRDAVNPEWTTEQDDDGRNEIVSARPAGDSQLTVFGDDEVTQAQIIRGDIQNTNVDSEVLNFERSVDRGVARIRRQPTILPVMGLIDFNTEHAFLGDVFQYGQMGIGNYSRRVPRIYETELDFLYDDAAIQNAIASAQAARDPACLAIDEDQEFFDYWRDWCRVPDFHARARGFTSLDREYVKENVVDPLIRSGVPRVPERMVQGTIGLYRRMQSETEDQAEIDRLQALIDELEEYLAELRNSR